MTTKKRFYIEDAFKCYFLRDRNTPINDVADQCVHTAAIREPRAVKYLQELCDLLNKGHETTEADAFQARIANMVESEKEVLDRLADGPNDNFQEPSR